MSSNVFEYTMADDGAVAAIGVATDGTGPLLCASSAFCVMNIENTAHQM